MVYFECDNCHRKEEGILQEEYWTSPIGWYTKLLKFEHGLEEIHACSVKCVEKIEKKLLKNKNKTRCILFIKKEQI